MMSMCKLKTCIKQTVIFHFSDHYAKRFSK